MSAEPTRHICVRRCRPKAAMARKTGGRELQCCVIKPTSSVTSSELIDTTSGDVILTRVGKLPFRAARVNTDVG